MTPLKLTRKQHQSNWSNAKHYIIIIIIVLIMFYCFYHFISCTDMNRRNEQNAMYHLIRVLHTGNYHPALQDDLASFSFLFCFFLFARETLKTKKPKKRERRFATCICQEHNLLHSISQLCKLPLFNDFYFKLCLIVQTENQFMVW